MGACRGARGAASVQLGMICNKPRASRAKRARGGVVLSQQRRSGHRDCWSRRNADWGAVRRAHGNPPGIRARTEHRHDCPRGLHRPRGNYPDGRWSPILLR